jgi:hypothetical protein
VPSNFACRTQVKENALDLLRPLLSRVSVDVVATSDYQPAARRSGPSRRMLAVCLELGFPVVDEHIKG